MPDRQQLTIERGAGAHVFDTNGRRYIDCVLGSGPLVAGHAHPAVVQAIQEQAPLGTQYYTLNFPAIELAERIIDIVPCAEQVKFASTGAEATFQALRLARAYTGRDGIVRFRGAYHGHHDYGMLGASAGIPATLETVVATATFNDAASVAEIFDQRDGKIAAVIVEPIHRIIAPQPGFLEFLRQKCSDAGALLIFDEVVTGFRLARGGAQEKYGVIPDLATYGKVIGGGLPLAAVAGPADVLELTNARRPGANYVYFSGTLNGNPLSAAAGNATLTLLDDEDGYARLESTSRELRKQLSHVAVRSQLPLQVTGDGPVIGVVFAEGDPRDPGLVDSADRAALRRLETKLLEHGIFTNLTAKIYLSIAHTGENVDTIIEAFATALQTLDGEETNGDRNS
jgi:glutamate-1-semialdehyde 2,1-aminomutase